MRQPGLSVTAARLVRAVTLTACSILAIACGGAAASSPASPAPSPLPSASSTAGASESAPPESSTTSPGGTSLEGVPTACVGLGEQDCRRVVAQVATALTQQDPSIAYVQVGPFGCPGGLGCPTTLVARSEGDVTLESADGAIGLHIKAIGADLDVQRQDAVGIKLPPSSTPPALAGPQPFTLGHCGLWSGIDVGGSWWDPVGLVDYDHGDAINAAEGSIAPVGPDEAIFASKSGFTVRLVRHTGPKFLPLCK